MKQGKPSTVPKERVVSRRSSYNTVLNSVVYWDQTKTSIYAGQRIRRTAQPSRHDMAKSYNGGSTVLAKLLNNQEISTAQSELPLDRTTIETWHGTHLTTTVLLIESTKIDPSRSLPRLCLPNLHNVKPRSESCVGQSMCVIALFARTHATDLRGL